MMGESSWNDIFFINDKYYCAEVSVNGMTQNWLFDLSGKKVLEIPQTFNWNSYKAGQNGFTDKYMVTYYGIYTYNKKCVFEFATSDLFVDAGSVDMSLTISGNDIYLTKVSMYGTNFELYKFDGSNFVKEEATEIEVAAPNSEYLPNGNKATVLFKTDEFMQGVMGNDLNYTWTLYKANGEALLKMQATNSEIYGNGLLTYCKDVAYVETTTPNGEPIIYVVK